MRDALVGLITQIICMHLLTIQPDKNTAWSLYSINGWSPLITGIEFNCFGSHARRQSRPTYKLILII